MRLEIECPFKEACVNEKCTVKLYTQYYYSVYNMCDILKDIDYVLPNFFVTSVDYGNKICLRCYNFKGKN
jgi:hypothetical protein